MASDNQRTKSGASYGNEGGAYGGVIDSYNEIRASASSNGKGGQRAASAAGSATSHIGDKAAYELLDREMQYMLKFADPDSNVASMDELIQSGVDLLDLLPPEDDFAGVKPRFSNPSTDWKYDIIAKAVDACNPISDCTCYQYDTRKHDIHLCLVHHDTVSQDSDTLTMDTEGSLVNIPTIKLHASCVEGNAKSNTSSSSTNNSVDDNTRYVKEQSQQYYESDIIDITGPYQEILRTEANNAGSNTVGYEASENLQGQSVYNEDSSGDKSGTHTVDSDNHSYEYHGGDNGTNIATIVHSDGSNRSSCAINNVNKGVVGNHAHPDWKSDKGVVTGTTGGTGHHGDFKTDTKAETSEGQADAQDVDKTSENSVQNATVFAEVHVDATSVKYDDTTVVATNTDNSCRKEAMVHKEGQQSPIKSHSATQPQANDGSNYPANDNAHSFSSAGRNENEAESAGGNSASSNLQSNPSDTSKNTSTTCHAAKNNPDIPTHEAKASTSKHKENYEMFLSRPSSTSVEEHRRKALKKRPSLPIEPRTTQYQKHALLQERSDTGVLEFELLLAEKMDIEPPRFRRESDTRKRSLDSVKMKLMPRTNQYEQHALLRKTDSGMSEIEELLQEKEIEFIHRMNVKTGGAQVNSTEQDSKRLILHRGSLGRLEPRLVQYEKHSLLQSKDEEGRSALEMFLEEEMLERKASITDQDVLSNYSDKEKLAPRKSNASDTSSKKGSIKKSRSKSSIKKVHFERNGSKDKQKVEEPESGISSKGEGSSASEHVKQDVEGQCQGQEVDNGYDTDDDDKTEEDRLTGERAKAKLNKDQGKCCTIL